MIRGGAPFYFNKSSITDIKSYKTDVLALSSHFQTNTKENIVMSYIKHLIKKEWVKL